MAACALKSENISDLSQEVGLLSEVVDDEEASTLFLEITQQEEMPDIQPRGKGRGSGKNKHGTFVCPNCAKSFTTKSNLKTHQKIHTNEKAFVCDVKDCGKSFVLKESLRRHTNSHLGIKEFTCDCCLKQFSCKNARDEHRLRHTGELPYRCELCGKMYRQMSGYRRHMVTHKDPPVECNLCRKKFANITYLKSHMRTHTGEKPYACDVCDRRFAYQSDVKRHKYTHSDAKAFHCEVCGDRFTEPSARRRHEKEHTSEKAFSCALCAGVAFKRSGQLKTHLEKKHPNLAQSIITKEGNTGALHFDFSVVRAAGGSPSPAVTSRGLRVSPPARVTQDRAAAGLPPNPDDLSPAKVAIENDVSDTIIRDDENVLMTYEEVIHYAPSTQGLAVRYANDSDVTEPIPSGAQGSQSSHNLQQLLRVVQSETQKQVASPLPVTSSDGFISVMPTNGNTVSFVQPSNQHQSVVAPSIDQPHIIKATIHHLPVQQAALRSPPPANQEPPPPPPLEDKPDDVMDYVNHPDFSSQAYYDWLSVFTDLARAAAVPLEKTLYTQISQVHKALSDVLASPEGALRSKDNFMIVMGISKELSNIADAHLLHVLNKL